MVGRNSFKRSLCFALVSVSLHRFLAVRIPTDNVYESCVVSISVSTGGQLTIAVKLVNESVVAIVEVDLG